MKQKEIILNQLKSMGFDPIEIGDLGYAFQYEDVNYLYMPDDDDEHFLRIAIPHLLEVTDENRIAILEAMQETGLRMKYSKVCIMYQAPWAIYEHRLSLEKDLCDLLEHMIRVLEVTAAVFCKKAMGEDIDFPSEDPEDTDDDQLEKELDKMLDMTNVEEYN